MSEWKEMPIGDLITLQRGHDLVQTEFVEGEYAVAGSNGLIGFHNQFTTNGPGLTLGRSGNSIGVAHYYESPFWAHNTVLYSKQFHGSHPKFLYYLFKCLDFKSMDAGSAVPTLNRNHLYPILVKVPTDFNEQKCIAEILSSLDDKIDLLHRQNKTLEQLAETLFRQWFVEEAEEGWEKTTFGEFVKPKKGRNITKADAIEGDYAVVAGGLEPSCYHNQSNTSEPVITVSSSGANAGFVRLYHSRVWASDCSFIDDTITSYVFFSYVFLKINQEILFDKQEGSAQPHVYPSHIMEIEMFKYPKSKIEMFEEEITPVFQKIKSNTIQIKTLTQLRDTLLPKLMSGEVKININETATI